MFYLGWRGMGGRKPSPHPLTPCNFPEDPPPRNPEKVLLTNRPPPHDNPLLPGRRHSTGRILPGLHSSCLKDHYYWIDCLLYSFIKYFIERNTGHAGVISSEEACDSQPSPYTCKRGYREWPDPPELDLVRGEVEGACVFYFPGQTPRHLKVMILCKIIREQDKYNSGALASLTALMWGRTT